MVVKRLVINRKSEMKTELDIDNGRNELEKLMMGLSPEITEEARRSYLAGYIDCLARCGQISEETRGILYSEYAF
jgi:hypothetical protein